MKSARYTFASLLALAACGTATSNKKLTVTTTATTPVSNYGHFKVAKEVDGDTIAVEDATHSFKVRFYEIDTPETHHPGLPVQCGGPAAAAETARLIPVGTTIILKADPRLDKTDRYGRTLAYVYKRNLFVNLRLVRDGMAHAYHFRGKRGIYADRIDKAEADAKAHKRGFWNPTGCNGNTTQPEKK